jgi:hypothetical protein
MASRKGRARATTRTDALEMCFIPKGHPHARRPHPVDVHEVLHLRAKRAVMGNDGDGGNGGAVMGRGRQW